MYLAAKARMEMTNIGIQNDPFMTRLTRQVSVRVLRPFHVDGRPRSKGDIVSIPYDIARGLAALGKAEFVNPADGE